MKLRIVALFCLFLIGCDEAILEGTVLKEAPYYYKRIGQEPVEKPCLDPDGNPATYDQALVFWLYARLDPVETTFLAENIGIQFQYEGPEFIYYPLESTSGQDLEKFIHFSGEKSDGTCLSEGVDSFGTGIQLYENGMIWEGYSVKDRMEDLSAESHRPIEEITFGKNTYSRIRGRNLGSGLADFYFIENGKDVYQFTFSWLGVDMSQYEDWWNHSSLPKEYEKVLETVEFL